MTLNTEEQACIDARNAALKTAAKHLNTAARSSVEDEGDTFASSVAVARKAIERAEEHDEAYDRVPA